MEDGGTARAAYGEMRHEFQIQIGRLADAARPAPGYAEDYETL